MAAFSLPTPFYVIDKAYGEGIKIFLDKAVGSVQAAVAGPLLACVTLWVVVQGILVMRGDIDTRRGITRIISVALVVGLVSSSSLYNDYVETLFERTIPEFVVGLGGDFGISRTPIPVQLDVVFSAGQAVFLGVSKAIPVNDELDALAFEGAQLFFYINIWGIFGVYDTITILTDVLVTFGPLIIIAWLFEATRGIAVRWTGQLISYALLYLLTSVVASAVIATMAGFMGATFALASLLKQIPTIGTVSAQLIGLYEIDFFIMTGNALVIALPAIAASMGGGVGFDNGQIGQSIVRRFARGAGNNTIRALDNMR